MSLDDYSEIVEHSTFEETEYMTESESKSNPSWTLGDPGNCINIWTLDWKIFWYTLHSGMWDPVNDKIFKIYFFSYSLFEIYEVIKD